MKSVFTPTEHEAEDWAGDPRAGRIGELGRPSVTRLVIWFLILGVSIAALRMLLGPSITWQSNIGHALLEVCGVLITGGIVYCLWMQYCVSSERWILITAIAFSGLMIGELVHAVTLGAALNSTGTLQKLGFHYYLSWKLVAAGLLIISSGSTALESKHECRDKGLHVFGTAALLSFCITGSALILVRLWPRIESTLPDAFVKTVYQLDPYPLISGLCLAALGLACLKFAQRHIHQEDVFSDGIAKCLMLMTCAQAASLVSASEYDVLGWLSRLMWIGGLSVLLVRLGAEFGSSYADAHARVEHLETVHHISSRLNNTLDLGTVLRVLVSDMSDMLSARFASVMLVDEEGGSLATAVTHGLPEEPLGSNRPNKLDGKAAPGSYEGHTLRAFREKRICVVDDVHTDVEFVPWKLLARYDGYAVSVPLIYQENALGVLNLFFDKHIRLNDERLRLFQTLASAGAVAVYNAQLYGKTVRESEAVSAEERQKRFRLAS